MQEMLGGFWNVENNRVYLIWFFSTFNIRNYDLLREFYCFYQVEEKSALIGDIQMYIECKPEYTNQAKGFLVSFIDVIPGWEHVHM